MGLAWLAAPAVAQQASLDMHGPVPPPVAGDPSAPLLIWGLPSTERGAWSAGALVELADEAAAKFEVPRPGAPPERVAGLETLAAVNLGGRYALGERVGIAGTLPVFLGTRAGDLDGDGDDDGGGLTLGDLHLWLPVTLVPPRGAFGVSAVPWVTVPTGDAERQLGDEGFGFGALGAASWRPGPLGFDVNLGLGRGPRAPRATQRFGGLEVPLGGAVSARLSRALWLGAELRGVVDVGGGAVAEGGGGGFGIEGAPLEGLLTVRTRPSDRLWAAGAVGRGLSPGLGAANLRGLFGLGAGSPLPRGPEPRAQPVVTLRVLGPDGVPVGAAEVLVGGEVVAVADGEGLVALEALEWSEGVALRAPHRVETVVPRLAEDVLALDVVLPWVPSTLQATVVDEHGRPIDAMLRVQPLGGGEGVEGRPGEIEVPPGRYRVEIVAEGLGAQVREVEVESAGRPPMPLDVVLLPFEADGEIVLRVADADGAQVDGARVLLDGRPVGSTADGGLVQVGGLASGAHDIEIGHDAFTARTLGAVADGRPVPVTLQRSPGTVRLVVRGPDDAVVPDAIARFLGPRRLAAMPLGETGRRDQVLGVGTWTLLVTSPSSGVQERVIEVPPDAWDPIDVHVVLQPDEGGDAGLTVRVVDPAGRPVEGATVLLDDEAFGETSTGGTLTLAGLDAGVRRVSVEGPGLRPGEPVDVRLSEGEQERIVPVRWDVGAVDVTVLGPEGPAPDAVVRFLGAEGPPPVRLGASGHTRTTLPPGSWTVLVTSPTLGVQDRGLEILEDSDVLHVVEVRLSPSEGGLAELSLRVVDPLGRPVEGARVALDDRALGATSNVGTLSQKELAVGSRVLTVAGEPFAEHEGRLRLLEGAQEVEVTLDWAPGTVRVRATSEGEPVSDAVIRFLGPESRDPVTVDPEGERLATLGSGSWTVLAVSPTAGVAEQVVELEEAQGLQEVTLDLVAAGVGLSDLVLRVQDRDGRPVAGARVVLDDGVAGVTDARGTLISRGLLPGEVALDVEAERFQPVTDRRLVLGEGIVEPVVTLEWVPVEVEVRTVDGAGAPVAASVRWVEGGADVDEVLVDASGVARVAVPPDGWRVIATAGELAGDARVDLAPGDAAGSVEITLKSAVARLAERAVVIRERVRFDFDAATLRPDSVPILDEVARALVSRPEIIRVEVQGHTDDIGSVPVNQALSQARAQAVVAALVERGVPPEKLVARGYGTQRPLAPNDSDEGRALNRRVQFDITETSDQEE